MSHVLRTFLAFLLCGAALACGDKSTSRGTRGEAAQLQSTVRDAAPTAAPSAPPPPPAEVPLVGEAGGVAGRVAGDVANVAPERRAARPEAMPAPAPAGAPGAQIASSDTASAAPAMLIRTGQASIEVDSLEPAIAAVRALAQRMGGYVANTSLAAGREQVRAATLQLKVPSARFDALVGGLAPLGRVEMVNVSAEDVGEEYVDVAARVANARRLEARLLTLLERSAARLSDVLSVERELARVREEIERAEGRMRFLRTRVALSTLDVTVHERAPILPGAPSRNPLLEALRQAWRNFVAVLAFGIASLGVLIPLGVVALVVWRFVRARKANP
ncbi:DUF4349 domain-containing protein [Roseisolibacter agri]|uniref:DUF4349 domain-containing protein n=1 Tax=Roseisolibacter agri TaxID=2014610 RepID=A0AA37QFH0_9BACT|nr:DUF4349 domain-containing protein [Roseisolibacter agri]GLC25425.1 hypothetical protein rosag_19380 [Roseisolibacter agri]